MRARLVLWLSLGLNIALAVMVLTISRDWDGTTVRFPAGRDAKTSISKPGRTNVVIRRQFFNWSELESTDYRSYIENLRKIGCPEDTIRDIIVADINHLFDQRKLSEIETPDQQWWRSEPDMDVLELAANQIEALEKEKRTLLTDLLGPGWERQRVMQTGDPIRFDGPVLSKLPLETKRGVLDVERAAAERLAEYLRRRQEENLEPEPRELAGLRERTRSELAQLLNPQQLEEYLLRYSDTADNLREQLRGLEASPDEFRKIFRLADAYALELQRLPDSNDPSIAKRRSELEKMRDESIRLQIGNERFGVYKLTQNPLFRDAQAQAEQNGAPPEKVIPIFEINQATQTELERIRRDRTLSAEQREAALEATRDQQMASIQRILEPPEAREEEVTTLPAIAGGPPAPQPLPVQIVPVPVTVVPAPVGPPLPPGPR